VDGKRKVAGRYLSPDAWNQRGNGHTLADQMQAASGIGFEPARNDRLGGAVLIYGQLERGELIIADSCRQLREAPPTRIHDPHRPDDICKITGDPLDDCIDALRYAVYSFVGPAVKSAEQRAAEAATSTDPTIAAIQRRVAESKLQQASGGNYLRLRRGSGR